MDLTQKLVGLVVSIAASIRADSDTPKAEAVKVILDIDFSGCSINDMAQYAAADRKIAYVNGTGRKSFISLKPGQHIKVMAGAPNKVFIDPKVEYKAWFATLSPEDKAAEIAKLTA